jgi:type II secretory pathway component PulF
MNADRKLMSAGLSAEELVRLNEEIASLARAGLPLDQGLAALAAEMGHGRIRRVTTAVAADLQAGRTLPEALERRARRIPPYYAALVAVGVRSGRLAEVLSTLTSYSRAMAELKAAVLGALLYPSIIFCAGMGLVIGCLYFIIPRFEKIFADFKMKLPWLTEFVLGLSHHPVLYFVLPPLLFVGFLIVLRFLLGASAAGRRLWARWVYAIPVLGTLIRASRLASFTDLLAILVEQDVPLPEAFRLAGAASTDPLIVARSRLVEEDLRRGQPLGETLRSRRALPDVAAWLAGVGQTQNTLAVTLRRVSELYRRQAELRAALLHSVLPPVLIIVAAVLVIGVFLLAAFMPLLGLLEGLSGGGKK